MKFLAELKGVITAYEGETDADIVTGLDRAMEEFVALAASDPAIDLDLETHLVTISLIVEASNPILGLTEASGTIRTALHAAEIGTPDWPTEEAQTRLAMKLRSTHVDAIDEVDGELLGA